MDGGTPPAAAGSQALGLCGDFDADLVERDDSTELDQGVLSSCLAEGSDDESGYSPSLGGGEPYSDEDENILENFGGEADGGL